MNEGDLQNEPIRTHFPCTPFHQSGLERHMRETQTALDDYLETKRAELAADLAGKKLIYLDTCHWWRLVLARTQDAKKEPAYERILTTLERLRREQRVCCPVSSRW